MTLHEKVLTGMEKLSKSVDEKVTVVIENYNNQWIIKVYAGNRAAVSTDVATFVRNPQILLEPFGEEIIKTLK
mgnify:CR=1 FL=1